MTGTDDLKNKIELLEIDESNIPHFDMFLSLTSFELRDSAVDFNMITTIPTQYSYVSDMKSNSVAANIRNIIHFHVTM